MALCEEENSASPSDRISRVSRPQLVTTNTSTHASATFNPTLVRSSASPQQTQDQPIHTVSSALALLRSLKPSLDEILSDDFGQASSGQSTEVKPDAHDLPSLDVTLDTLDIMRPSKPPKSGSTADHNPDDIWADVMYLAPRETDVQGRKLRKIADLVYKTFQKEGYVTDTRPLKLHCTVLNTSKRRPARARGQPFCYSDVLGSEAMHLLGVQPTFTSSATNSSSQATISSASAIAAVQGNSSTSAKAKEHTFVSPPVAVNLMANSSASIQAHATTVNVKELGLWIMGSHGPRGEYVSCGSVKLGEDDGSAVVN